ncbi:MAG: Asp-tRNA(Asn)/Glu-tRNA(Gln) amidotransferase subunit GatC [Ignavibacteriales bacterium]|nr:Asp-tRNA(Asn)/Glu-tRNA(Gln) amidotransferase subunit GatC [Ignavibacteriales bacterium]MBP9122709.1 Asp-tRNA(Asn)/Glu-tRNA(Gln) amidotransferase subunit GatC [Ignavibacteriaceae bacterium]MCC6637255.1 Asp-tRNA(Asn)/Glu-tRNA(Gln) amidotransferase subunit GatC [Ignavibacteriaceae bacterium]
MSISVDDVRYVAKLSMLEFEEDELIQFTKEFNKIIEYVDQLNDLDLSDIEPLYHPIEGSKATLREDITQKSISHDEAFLNAPDHEDGFFIVPKVI